MEKTYYEIFGISENASYDEIKRAYRRLAFFYHPDKNGGALKYENIFKEVNKIYQTLSNLISRREYDAQLRRSRNFQPRQVHKPVHSVNLVVAKKKPKKYRWAAIVTYFLLRIIFNSSTSSEQSDNYKSELTDYVSNGYYISNAPSFILTDTTTLLSYLNKTQ